MRRIVRIARFVCMHKSKLGCDRFADDHSTRLPQQLDQAGVLFGPAAFEYGCAPPSGHISRVYDVFERYRDAMQRACGQPRLADTVTFRSLGNHRVGVQIHPGVYVMIRCSNLTNSTEVSLPEAKSANASDAVSL